MRFRLIESLEDVDNDALKRELYELFITSFYSRDTAMELICENLYYNLGIDARYKGNTIYENGKRIMSVDLSREDIHSWAIYRIRTYGMPNLEKYYTVHNVIED